MLILGAKRTGYGPVGGRIELAEWWAWIRSVTFMSAAFDFDNDVTAAGPLLPAHADDPFARLFCDRTTTSGIRLLAVAEPVDRKPEGYLAAAAAIAAFEEALSVAVLNGAEAGLQRAFVSANDAIRSSNRRVMASKRSFVGITAVVINGQSATIGFVPPGQALLIQDGKLYGVPDLASWKTGFMPVADQDAPDPLGFSATVRPQIRTTEIGVDDQFVLGASAVGRVLAHQDTPSLSDSDRHGVITRLEEALADSGVDDAYAAWIRCDPAPEITVSTERMAEFERIWRGQQPAVLSPLPSREVQTDPKLRRAASFDALHIRLIEASERVFARKEPVALPLDSRRRQITPLGAGSLERYVAPRILHVGPGLRSVMPRGMRISVRSLLGLIVVLTVVTAIALTKDVELGSGSSQDELLSQASTELQLARASATDEEALAHLAVAQRAVDKALGKGSDSEVAAGWRNEIAQATDKANGVIRLGEISRIGSMPESFAGSNPQLLFAFNRIYLLADGVYEVGASDHQLLPVLLPGDVIESTSFGTVQNAAADANGMLVSDGTSLFTLDRSGNWSAMPLERTLRNSVSQTGLYKGSYYVLDAPVAQVTRLSGTIPSAEPVALLSEEAMAFVSDPVDLAVDGYVYLLEREGSVKVFFKGEYKGSLQVLPDEVDQNVVGLFRGDRDSDLYVVAVKNGAGTLAIYDRTEHETSLYALPTEMHLAFNPEAEAAFANAIDFVVDESTQTLYFVTTEGLWQASLH